MQMAQPLPHQTLVRWWCTQCRYDVFQCMMIAYPNEQRMAQQRLDHAVQCAGFQPRPCGVQIVLFVARQRWQGQRSQQ